LAGSGAVTSRLIKIAGSSPVYVQDDQTIDVTAGITTFQFDLDSGGLISVRNGSRHIPFGNGPILQISGRDTTSEKPEITVKEKPSALEIGVKGHPDFKSLDWSVYGSGWLKLEYSYDHKGPVDYMGVSFSYPETGMNKMTWLGRGPYRVWKNREKGGYLDVWENTYNSYQVNTSWDYPEFPGYYSDFKWARFDTSDGPVVLAAEDTNLYLRVYSQKDGEDPRHTTMKWPEGDISIMHAIPAIGTKFTKAADTGPQGKEFQAEGLYRGTLWFYFGIPEAPGD
jgi:hypothetical protein